MSREQPEATKTAYSEPYNAGYEDYQAGYSDTECHYERGSDEADAWWHGWLDAEADKAAEGKQEEDELDRLIAKAQVEAFFGLEGKD